MATPAFTSTSARDAETTATQCPSVPSRRNIRDLYADRRELPLLTLLVPAGGFGLPFSDVRQAC